MPEKMFVKESPRRIEGLPVVKALFLGWLSRFRQEGGYVAHCVTYGVTDADKGEQYQTHIMWAGGMDKPWRRIESALELTREQALAKSAEHEKLAVWPEGN